MKFEELKLKPELVAGLAKIGLTEATECQEKAIPIVLAGHDLIVRSKTGSGKTFAFLLPVMHGITSDRYQQALILAPTRELAQQIDAEARKLDGDLDTCLLYGGVAIGPQIDLLERGAQLVIATPGRLLDHLSRGTIDLSKVRFVVLDEADRMLDMGFIEDVGKILDNTSKDRITLLFSATMPPKMEALAGRHMKTPKELMLQQDEICVKQIRQKVIGLDRRKKLDELMKILKDKSAKKVMIFSNTKSWAEKLGTILLRKRFKATSIHSGLSQNKRTRVIQDFNSGKVNILVATDVAARGLHIEGVTHVVNYDVPRNPKDYVHRIGRTGRAGKDGDAITFVCQMDAHMLKAIEQEINMFLEVQYMQGGKPMSTATSATPYVPRQMNHSTPISVHTHGDNSGDDWGLD